MDIGELQARQGGIEVNGEIILLGKVREVSTARGPGRVCSAKIKDKTGEIALTLWNEEIDRVSIGDLIKISKGFVTEYRGELQLSTGKFGTLEVLEKQKGLLGSVTEHAIRAATKDELEEAAMLSGHVDEEPTVDEVITPDNVVESDIVTAAEEKSDNVVQEDIVLSEEEFVDE